MPRRMPDQPGCHPTEHWFRQQEKHPAKLTAALIQESTSKEPATKAPSKSGRTCLDQDRKVRLFRTHRRGLQVKDSFYVSSDTTLGWRGRTKRLQKLQLLSEMHQVLSGKQQAVGVLSISMQAVLRFSFFQIPPFSFFPQVYPATKALLRQNLQPHHFCRHREMLPER